MKAAASEFYTRKLLDLPDADARWIDRGNPPRRPAGVHILGICGTAMAPLAGLLRQAGFEVSGSDEGCYPPISELVESLDIEVHSEWTPAALNGKDAVIVGNVVRADNPEVRFALEHRIPILSLPEALRLYVFGDRRTLLVAGTHGKTTTAGLMAHVMASAGRRPSCLIGGSLATGEPGFKLDAGAEFVIEADEYDTAFFDKSPKFLNYRPHSAIVTSLEFDHADIFASEREYERAFEFLAGELERDGTLVLFAEDERVRRLRRYSTAARIITYGLCREASVTAREVTVAASGLEFVLVVDGESQGRMTLPLFGEHNLRNALAVCALTHALGLRGEELERGLATFPGMRRRQQVRALAEPGIVVIDDFAHHPTAVTETIRSVRQRFPGRRVVAIFEPRSNTSRRKLFEGRYADSLAQADACFVIQPPFRHNDSEDDFIDVAAIAGAVEAAGKPAVAWDRSIDLLVERLGAFLRRGDVALAMSNGSFDDLPRKLAERLAP